MSDLKKILLKDYRVGALIVAVPIFLYLLQLGPLFAPDSQGYINYHVHRSCLYPLFLKVFLTLSGGSFFFICFLQLAVGIGSCFYLAQAFYKFFQEKKGVFYICFFMFLTPYLLFANIGNHILSEALTYPLFLLFFTCFIKLSSSKQSKYFYSLVGLAGSLILVRRQFLFLYPFIVILLGYGFFFNVKWLKKGLFVVVFIFSAVAVNVVEKGYAYMYSGQFKTVPFTGIQLVAMPLYVASPDDQKVLEGKEKIFFNHAMAEISQKNISGADEVDAQIRYYHFYKNYNLIVHGVVSRGVVKTGIDNAYVADNVLINTALKLIKNNPVGWFKNYFYNILINLGGWYYSFIVGIVFILSALTLLKNKTLLSFLCTFTILLQAGNYALVALVEPILRRYAIYTDVLLVGLILSIMYMYVTQKKDINLKKV